MITSKVRSRVTLPKLQDDNSCTYCNETHHPPLPRTPRLPEHANRAKIAGEKKKEEDIARANPSG